MSDKYFLDVGCGFIPGRSVVNVFGFADNVQEAQVPCMLWDLKTPYSYPTAGETWEILSNSSADTFSGGTGAQLVMVDALDHNFNQVPQFVQMNGINPVTLPGGPTYLRVNGMTCVQAGSALSNVGNITLRQTGGGLTRGYIAATRGSMSAYQYTVPTGKVFSGFNFVIVTGKSGGAIGTWTHQFTARLSNNTEIKLSTVTFVPGNVPIDVPTGFHVPAQTTFDVRIDRISTNGLDVSFQSTGILTTLNDPSVINRVPSPWTYY